MYLKYQTLKCIYSVHMMLPKSVKVCICPRKKGTTTFFYILQLRQEPLRLYLVLSVMWITKLWVSCNFIRNYLWVLSIFDLIKLLSSLFFSMKFQSNVSISYTFKNSFRCGLTRVTSKKKNVSSTWIYLNKSSSINTKNIEVLRNTPYEISVTQTC